MKNSDQPIKYALYARKSSEQEERQVASIESQKKELEELIEKEGLNVTVRLEESHSAKNPGRPIFNQLIELIRKGEVTGLLVWHPNRLSRNAMDLATLLELMQQTKLIEIKTPGQAFRGSLPMDQFFLLFSIGQAKLENDNKGIDVKRGLRNKCRGGIYPTRAPLGYVNDKYAERGNKTVLPDPDRFDLVRKLFDLMLTGRYTPPQLVKLADEELRLTSRSKKKVGRSLIYYTFHNPFYYGRFEYPLKSGEWYDGIHKPMITKSEYDRIQMLLKKNRHPLSKRPIGTFIYRGFLRCGECGAMITAEEKTKNTKDGVHHYTYYHCTHRIKPCTQKSIREEELEKLIIKGLEEIEIPKELHAWAMKELKRMNVEEIKNRAAMQGARRRQYDTSVQKIDSLIKMRANGELTEDEFKSSKENAVAEKNHFWNLLEEVDQRVDHWLEVAERCFDFAEKAKIAFSFAEDSETKTNILAALGSNLLLKDKILSIQWAIPFDRIRAMADEAKAISDRLEPENTLMTQGQKEEIYSNSSVMLPDLESYCSLHCAYKPLGLYIPPRGLVRPRPPDV